MTRDEFETQAIREAERQLAIPPGWWGTWRHVRVPDCHASMRFSRIAGWRIYGPDGAFISAHDSRVYALNKLKRIVRKPPERHFRFGT